MSRRGPTLLEVFILVILIGLVTALFVPAIRCGGHRKGATCANNLSQLYKLGTLYASMHQKAWPEAHGEDLWLSFTRTKPPLIEPVHPLILGCPVLGEECRPGETHYRGPRQPFKGLQAGDPLGADKPDNHGSAYGGNVLFKDGSVRETASHEPLWKKCADALRP